MNKMDVYYPELEVHPETAGLYPYTFNAHPGNSGERLQTLANLAGFTIYATDFMGQETGEIYGVPARDALAPNYFHKTCERQAEFVANSPFMAEHQVRIGMGDSLGVTSITGIFDAAQDMPTIFSALQLRDGFNLRRAQSKPALAYAGFLAYQVADLAQSKRPSSLDTYPLAPIADFSEIEERTGDKISVVANMYNLGLLMQGNQSFRGTLQAAKNPRIPVHVIGFKHGLSGEWRRVHDFFSTLHGVRRAVAKAEMDQDPSFKPAELVSQISAGWHSDLMDPSLAAFHLKLTRDLITL